jgi:hypothetical protein
VPGAPDAVVDPLAGLVELPGVAAAAESARVVVDRLLRHGVLRRRSTEVTTESARRGARASALLDGLVDTGDSPPVAAMRLYAELGTLLPAWPRAPRQVLARMHVLAARGRSADADLGRPRAGAVAEDPLGLGLPPTPEEVSGRLSALAELVVRRSSAPAIVVAGVVHGELLVLRPFVVGSGLVARAAARLTLVQRGLDSRSLGVPEVGHVASGPAYAVAARGYAAGGGTGVADWLVHCAGAVEAGAQEALAICEALRRG